MLSVKEYIESATGTDNMGVPKAEVDFVSSIVNIDTNEAEGIPIDCSGASIRIRDIGGYIMFDMTFSYSDATNMKMIYNYLEKYANDLDKVKDNDKFLPEVAFFVSSKQHNNYYILLINPLFWSWNTSNREGEYDSIRIIFEKDNYGYFLENDDDENIKSKKKETT